MTNFIQNESPDNEYEDGAIPMEGIIINDEQESPRCLCHHHQFAIKTKQSNCHHFNNQYKDNFKERFYKEQNLLKESQINYQKLLEHYNHDKNKWENEENQYRQIIETLQIKREELKAEAIQYQLALGSITNLRWDDANMNNSVNLNKDIGKLQSLLLEFTQLKGKAYSIKELGMNNLFEHFGSQSDSKHKPTCRAALQRFVIETILEQLDRYLLVGKNLQDNDLIERDLLQKFGGLGMSLENFMKMRKGTGNSINLISIKLRQEIFAILGNHGFANKDNQFVVNLKSSLLREMEKYRKIESPDKSVEQEARAVEIILEVVRILYFRVRAQEPIISLRWFDNGEPLNRNMMEWASDGDDHDKVVDICAFPVIGINLDHPEIWQIYTKAKVQICKINDEPRKKSSRFLGIFSMAYWYSQKKY
ncbi:hypothetical protein G9A89_015822 [Geosiphon pyriformis]|nr:hypothetical protein G9A89_015822 [Geosiphon pyriformis]